MQRKLPVRKALALAAALCAAATPLSSVAATDTDALVAQVKALAERVERLEAQNTQLRSALETDRISENEPELATRIKAVEAQQQALRGPHTSPTRWTASAWKVVSRPWFSKPGAALWAIRLRAAAVRTTAAMWL